MCSHCPLQLVTAVASLSTKCMIQHISSMTTQVLKTRNVAKAEQGASVDHIQDSCCRHSRCRHNRARCMTPAQIPSLESPQGLATVYRCEWQNR